MRYLFFVYLSIHLLLYCGVGSAEGSKLPLWELGVGVGSVWMPDYPGSDKSRLWTLPFPWGVYRGDVFRSDREGGTRARLLKGASYELNFSAGGGLPSSSEDNEARRGLPDLEWMLEFGPRILFDLYTGSDRSHLRLGIPARAALSTNGPRAKDRGWVYAPELLLSLPTFLNSQLDGFAILTTTFADRRFSSYFYEVQEKYARTDRAAYQARAGYIMSDLSLGLGYTIPRAKLRLFAFGSVQSLHGAINHSSPLLRQEWTTSYSVALLWGFAESSRHVQYEGP